MPGCYRLTVKQDNQPLYDQSIEIANAERKVIDLRNSTQAPFLASTPRPGRSVPENQTEQNRTLPAARSISPKSLTATDSTASTQTLSRVHITAFDANTEIWLNRERVGKGEWQGELAPGFYAVSSQKDSLDSRTELFWVEAGKTVELNLASPLADYGMLNISCNEVNAEVFLNDMPAGFAPCVLRNLPIDRTYRIRLVKGKKVAEKTIHLRGNDIVNVSLNLKKR